MYPLGMMSTKLWNELERINMVLTALILSFAISLLFRVARIFVKEPPEAEEAAPAAVVDINNNDIQSGGEFSHTTSEIITTESPADEDDMTNDDHEIVQELTKNVETLGAQELLTGEIKPAISQTIQSGTKSQHEQSQIIRNKKNQSKSIDPFIRGWNEPLFWNQTFVMVFDVPTPRPHLIIKHGQAKKKGGTSCVKDLTDWELNQLYDLIVAFRHAFALDEKRLVLSFHTGVWATDPKFHAHLCLETSDYIRIFNEANVSVEGFKPNRKWAVKHHSTCTTMNDVYTMNVEHSTRSSLEQTQKYLSEELSAIESGLITPYNINMVNPSYFKTCFDVEAPHVTWKPSDLTVNLFKLQPKQVFELLIKEMCTFAYSLGLFDRKSGDGAHICVNLGAESTSNSDTLDSYLSGYVQLRADTYYSISPRREEFFHTFTAHQRHSYNILT